MKLELAHAALVSLAIERRIADDYPQSREALGELPGHCEVILHELAHGLLLTSTGEMIGSGQIRQELAVLNDDAANEHEASAVRIVLCAIDQLGGLSIIDPGWILANANLRGRRGLRPNEQEPSIAERSVAVWLGKIVRQRARRIHDAAQGLPP